MFKILKNTKKNTNLYPSDTKPWSLQTVKCLVVALGHEKLEIFISFMNTQQQRQHYLYMLYVCAIKAYVKVLAKM